MARKTHFTAKKSGIFSAESPTCSSKPSAIFHAYISSDFPTFGRPCPQLPPLRRQRSSSLLSRRKGAKTPLVSAKNSLLFRKSPRFFLYCPLVPKVRPHTLLESSVCGLTSGLHTCTMRTREHRNGRLRDSGSSAASWSKATLSLNWGAFSSRASNRNNL